MDVNIRKLVMVQMITPPPPMDENCQYSHYFSAVSDIFSNIMCFKHLILYQRRHWMEVSPHHTMAGEVCGFFTWLWVFYRAKHDLPVVLGLRHPWEHGEDPWAIHDHVDNLEELQQSWEEFADKSTRPGEDDDDDDGKLYFPSF